MSKTMRLTLAGMLALSLAAGSASAAGSAKAELKDADGKTVGHATLVETPNGVLMAVDVRGLPPGAHAFHVHGVGKCEPPFTSAGGHYNPEGAAHGLHAKAGPHAGDLPNIHAPASGDLVFEVLAPRIALDDRLFDDDGAALVIHAGADDYASDPAGAAGARIVCGVVER